MTVVVTNVGMILLGIWLILYGINVLVVVVDTGKAARAAADTAASTSSRPAAQTS